MGSPFPWSGPSTFRAPPDSALLPSDPGAAPVMPRPPGGMPIITPGGNQLPPGCVPSDWNPAIPGARFTAYGDGHLLFIYPDGRIVSSTYVGNSCVLTEVGGPGYMPPPPIIQGPTPEPIPLRPGNPYPNIGLLPVDPGYTRPVTPRPPGGWPWEVGPHPSTRPPWGNSGAFDAPPATARPGAGLAAAGACGADAGFTILLGSIVFVAETAAAALVQWVVSSAVGGASIAICEQQKFALQRALMAAAQAAAQAARGTQQAYGLPVLPKPKPGSSAACLAAYQHAQDMMNMLAIQAGTLADQIGAAQAQVNAIDCSRVPILSPTGSGASATVFGQIAVSQIASQLQSLQATALAAQAAVAAMSAACGSCGPQRPRPCPRGKQPNLTRVGPGQYLWLCKDIPTDAVTTVL